MPKPNRGEVWLVDLGMAAKVRPCLVVSIPALVQDRAIVTVVTHTKSTRGSRFEVSVKTKYLDATGAFDAQSIVTIPEAKLLKKLGTLRSDQFAAVENAICQWLNLPNN